MGRPDCWSEPESQISDRIRSMCAPPGLARPRRCTGAVHTHLRYILPLFPTLATVKCLPSLVAALASETTSLPARLVERCRSTSVLSLT